MINLLPPEDQRQLVASRTNALILRYVFLLSVVIAVMALEMLGVYFLLNNDKQRYQATIDLNNEKAAAYRTVQQDADSFRSNLAISKYVLDKQIPYTSIIFAIANALPQGASLDGLSLVPSTFGTPTTLIVHTDTRDTALAVKAELQNASYENHPIFTSVSFESLTAASDTSSGTGGGYTATFNITYSKELGTQ